MSEEELPGPGEILPAEPPSTMSFHDGMQWMIWRDLERAKGMNQPQIALDMLEEAVRDGYEPFDFNYSGKANVYFRARYRVEEDGSWVWVSDGYAMFVKKVEE